MHDYRQIRKINSAVEAVLLALAVLVLSFNTGGMF